jgi:hypothetical protein
VFHLLEGRRFGRQAITRPMNDAVSTMASLREVRNWRYWPILPVPFCTRIPFLRPKRDPASDNIMNYYVALAGGPITTYLSLNLSLWELNSAQANFIKYPLRFSGSQRSNASSADGLDENPRVSVVITVRQPALSICSAATASENTDYTSGWSQRTVG